MTDRVLPLEQRINSFVTGYRRLLNGGMEVVVTPAAAADDDGVVELLTPQLVIRFAEAASWEAFKAEVAADGKEPAPETVVMPRVG